MENSFKKLESQYTLPEEVKKETFSNLDSMKLLLDIVDLFVIKASSTAAGSVSNSDTKLPPNPSGLEEVD